MPLNAFGWSSEEDERLVELVQPHSCLYNLSDPSRKNILARESTWQEIAHELFKPGKLTTFIGGWWSRAASHNYRDGLAYATVSS